MKTQFLAFLCRMCPFCNVARWRPNSAFAKKLAEMERNCPACRAYKRVYGIKGRA